MTRFSCRRRAALPVALLFTVACSVAEQRRLVPASVPIEVLNPLELELGTDVAQPHFAVVWTFEEGLYVGADVPLSSLEATFVAELAVPAQEVMGQAVPTERMRIRESFHVDVYRPRFVVYDDVDGNGLFEPPVLGLMGEDRVLAVESAVTPSVAVIRDLKEMLRGMRLEEAEAYYRSTENRYTPFVRAREDAGLQLTLGAATAPLFLSLTDSPTAQERLACGRQRVWLYGGIGPTSRVRARVDQGVDIGGVCGLVIPECEVEDLDAASPPELAARESDAVMRIVQCRATQGIEVLIKHDAIRTCEECLCQRRGEAEVFFIDPGTPPDWWPCGDTIEFCESTLPLYQIDTDCIEEEEEED